MITALKNNWKIYLIEFWALGMFMVSACTFVILIEHPQFRFAELMPSSFWRRLLIGIAMGLTAILLIYSKWGKKSGAHMNPAVTLANVQLSRMKLEDAIWYIIAQTAGAALFMFLLKLLLFRFVSHPSVNYVVTIPGNQGYLTAFIAELLMAAFLFIMVLIVSNSKAAKYTGYAAGILVCLFIWLEAPLSGMSINPSRSFGSAIIADEWNSFWIYLTAPVLGMQLAAFFYRRWYLYTNGECYSINSLMSGKSYNNKIYKVLSWWKRDEHGQKLKHKLYEQK